LPGPVEPLPAAQPGTISTWRFDRFGNRITSVLREAPFLAYGKGPGDLKTRVVEMGDGSVQIRHADLHDSPQGSVCYLTVAIHCHHPCIHTYKSL
jgi:hypothetical protein